MKTKKIFLIILSITLVLVIAKLNTKKTSASMFTSDLMSEDFDGAELSTDNWREAKERNDESSLKLVRGERYLRLNGPTYDIGSLIYIDKKLELGENSSLIIEFDIINEENYDSMFSFVTGLSDEEILAGSTTNETRSQMIVTGAGTNAMNVKAYGLPGDYFQYESFELVYNGIDYGPVAPVGGYGEIGYRHKIVCHYDGSVETYKARILDSGTYGEMENTLEVQSGRIENRLSGYVGFFFYFSHIGLYLRNVNLKTVVNNNETTVFTDSGREDRLKEEWKTINGNSSVRVESFPGALLFDNPKDNNYLVSAGSKYLTYDAVYDSYITLSYGLRIEELNGARKFGIAFGLETSSDGTLTEGVSYIFFRRNQLDNTKIELQVQKIVGGSKFYSNVQTFSESEIIDKDLKIEINPYVNGKIDFVINSYTYSFRIDNEKITLDKRFAFIADDGNDNESNSVKAYLSSIRLKNKYDLIPEDIVDLAIGFNGKDEKGNSWYDNTLFSFGGGLGYSKGNLDAGIFIENSQLVFRNAGHNSYFSPLKAFGDFYMQMDISDIAREDLYSDNGEIYRPFMRSWLGITFDLPSPGSPYISGYLLYITPMYESYEEEVDGETKTKFRASNSNSLLTLLGPGEAFLGQTQLRHNIIDPKLDGKDIVVRLTVYAGTMTFSYYVKGEESMEMLDTPVLTYDNNGLGIGHNGYLGITCTSGGENPVAGDFAIDNFVIKSLERNIDIQNDKDKPVVPKETVKPTDNNNNNNNNNNNQGNKNNNGCNSSLKYSIPFVITLGLYIFLFRRKKEECGNN